MDLSIIIVNFNTREFVLDCLRSIYTGSSGLTVEVFVVDNASGDGSADAIKSAYPQVRLIRNITNRGFAAANNQGLRLAQGRYVLLLNPDTLIVGDALPTMVAYMDGHADVGCAGCQVLLNETEIQMTCFRFPSALNEVLELVGLARLVPKSGFFGRYAMGAWDRRSERDVDVVSGMFMLVRREVVEDVGLMDEDYFVYAEEADWCWRIRQHGWRRVFTPIAKIIHREGGGQSSRLVSTRMYVQLQKSILIFIRKNNGPFEWLLTKAAYGAAMAARWCMLGAALPFVHGDRFRAKARQAAAAARYHWLGWEPTG